MLIRVRFLNNYYYWFYHVVNRTNNGDVAILFHFTHKVWDSDVTLSILLEWEWYTQCISAQMMKWVHTFHFKTTGMTEQSSHFPLQCKRCDWRSSYFWLHYNRCDLTKFTLSTSIQQVWLNKVKNAYRCYDKFPSILSWSIILKYFCQLW
jgi:hypothetical protein